MHDVFISYSHQDIHIAKSVLSILELNGIKCWIDYRDEIVGSSWAATIVRAIKASSVFIIIVSKNSIASQNVINELNSAENANKIIIPLRIDQTPIGDAFEYYLSKTHWLEATTVPIEDHLCTLLEIVHKHIKRPIDTTEKADPIPPVSPNARVCMYQDLLAMGYTSHSIALQLVENDYIICNGIGEDNEGTAEQWELFLQNDTDTFRYLVNENNMIIGDWSFLALNDDTFLSALKGELVEKNISYNNAHILCFPGVYHGFLLSFGILPEYRNLENHRLLIHSFLSQIEEYAIHDIFFDYWCINVFSVETESIIKQMGFRHICKNSVYGNIYSCPFIPLPNLPILKHYQKLVEKYEKIT